LDHDKSALVLLAEKDNAIEKSANNLKDVKTLRASYLNIRDLLGYDKIVMPLAALDVITGYLGNGIAAVDSMDEEE
jgi:large subunit ribosomal protein L4